MRAVVVTEDGPPENMTIGEVATPEPEADEVLVEVHATALNRADTFQRRGHYPPPEGASEILGLEMAGVVQQTGSSVIDWEAGDRVFALLAGGGYAEQVVVHKDMLMPIPPGLSMRQAAAIPEVFLTAYQALHWLGGLMRDHRVLIHAGASGVGTAAIQLVVDAGATAYVTASAPKHDVCRDLGAALAIDYNAKNFAVRVQEATNGEGVDIVIDFIGAPYFHRNVASLASDGRVIQLATMGGDVVGEVSLRDLMQKRAQILASTLRDRSLAYKIQLTQEFASEVLPEFIDGPLQPVIDSVYDWTSVSEAHRRMENDENAGKIVLQVLS